MWGGKKYKGNSFLYRCCRVSISHYGRGCICSGWCQSGRLLGSASVMSLCQSVCKCVFKRPLWWQGCVCESPKKGGRERWCVQVDNHSVVFSSVKNKSSLSHRPLNLSLFLKHRCVEIPSCLCSTVLHLPQLRTGWSCCHGYRTWTSHIVHLYLFICFFVHCWSAYSLHF